jgi:hypothetical protein
MQWFPAWHLFPSFSLGERARLWGFPPPVDPALIGQILISWTIRLALACFLACLLGWTVRARWTNGQLGRLVWTFGVIAFLGHIWAVFQYKLHWSHAAALSHTADGTQALMGFRFGEGIYFSYFFAVVWAADVAWWWISPHSHDRRPAWLGGLIIGYLVFIAFHGAIVFEGGPVRIVGIVGCLVLAALAARSWLGRKQPERELSQSSAEAAAP